MLFFCPLDRGDDIVLLAFSFVMLARTGSGSAKIEAQRREVRVFETSCGAKNDFVVERSAAQRMRMADDGNSRRILQIAIQRLQPPGTAVQIDVAKRLRIEIHVNLT